MAPTPSKKKKKEMDSEGSEREAHSLVKHSCGKIVAKRIWVQRVKIAAIWVKNHFG